VIDTLPLVAADQRHLRSTTTPGVQRRPVDNARLLPPRRQWLGHTAGWTGNPLPRKPAIRTRPNTTFSFTSEVRYWFQYQGGESLSFHRRRRCLGLRERQAGRGSGRRAPGRIWQYHLRRDRRDHVQPDRWQDLRDRHLPGRAQDHSVELQADPGPVQSHAHRLHAKMWRRCHQRFRDLRQRAGQFGHRLRRLHHQVRDWPVLRRWQCGHSPRARNATTAPTFPRTAIPRDARLGAKAPYCGDNKVDSRYGENATTEPTTARACAPSDCKAIVP
jgi:hypothetical protein